MDTLATIKESFEQWYNSTTNEKISIITNFSDEQTLSIKAYHKVTVSMVAVGIKDNMSYVIPILEVSENYNHGVTSEEDARDSVVMKFLAKAFAYCAYQEGA